METYDIDLSSDTKTKPNQAMREVMMNAEVGDEQIGEDPTVNRLISMVCEVLEKEDGLFLPTGTMCNMVAIRTHCLPGEEIIADTSAHIRHFETGGPAALSGCLIYPVEGIDGVFNVDQFKEAIRPVSNYHPKSTLVVIEQTSNNGGGSVWPIENIREISEMAVEQGIKRHMDGARLFNAVVKTGISAKEYSKHFDSVWIDFSKGLGAPMGAVLTGSGEFINRARRFKHQFGGAMRQAGIMAAACIYTLEHNIERMSIDHENARYLASELKKIEGINILATDTNMVFFSVKGLGLTASDFNSRLKSSKLRLSVNNKYKLRAVTHLDIDREMIETALEIIKSVL